MCSPSRRRNILSRSSISSFKFNGSTLASMPLAEQQKLAGQAGGPQVSFPISLRESLVPMVKCGILLQQAQVHQSGREDVVEIMRHAPGQLADRLHFLRLTQLLFQLFALR